MAEYYDFVLGAIPFTVAVIVAGLTVGGAAALILVGLGCLGAVGLICHAMFVRTPGRVDAQARRSNPSGGDSGYETAD